MVEIVWVLALIGTIASYFKMRRTWQWWSQRQSMRLHNEAETIRDQLLQESFTMRRRLESSLIDQPDASVQDCLEQFNLFHRTLNALSDRLSPPYIEDNLLLAIVHLLNSWKSKHTNLMIDFDHPATWDQVAHSSDGLILEVIDELLRITTANLLTPKVIFVSLNYDHRQVNLEIRVPEVESATIHSDLKHLAQAMHFLVGGHCSFSYHQQTLTWCYRQQRSAAFAKPTCKD